MNEEALKPPPENESLIFKSVFFIYCIMMFNFSWDPVSTLRQAQYDISGMTFLFMRSPSKLEMTFLLMVSRIIHRLTSTTLRQAQCDIAQW